MFNLLNRTTTMKFTRSSIVLTMLAIALALLAACRGSGPAPLGGNASQVAANTANVVITGAINKTYRPVKVTQVKYEKYVGMHLIGEEGCGVFLQFPIDLQPGAHPIGDAIHQPINDILAQYDFFCSTGRDKAFKSTKGTLTLTDSGAKYGGKFEFTAGRADDESKTVQVSGSFSEVSIQ
jgi:hypothetical protein